MHKILLSIVLAALIWSACTKSDFPDPIVETPVFMVKIDSMPEGPASTTAGEDGIYLFTEVSQRFGGFLVLSGTFADSKCPEGDCPGSLRFEFWNEWLEDFVRPDTLFSEGTWPYFQLYSPDLQPKTVAIRWVRSDGTVFRSDIFFPPPNQDSLHFNVSKSGSWENNENGEKTWKMNIDFACLLFDSTQQNQAKFVKGSGVIAVAYR